MNAREMLNKAIDDRTPEQIEAIAEIERKYRDGGIDAETALQLLRAVDPLSIACTITYMLRGPFDGE